MLQAGKARINTNKEHTIKRILMKKEDLIQTIILNLLNNFKRRKKRSCLHQRTSEPLLTLMLPLNMKSLMVVQIKKKIQ